MTTTRLRSHALFDQAISVPEFQELWRLFSDSIPLPIVLDRPRENGIRPAVERDEERRRTHATLVQGGYAVDVGEAVRPSRRAQDVLRVLGRPHREVDLRMTIRGEPVRAFAAVPRGGKVVRVTVRGPVVSIESVDTTAPDLAVLELLPPSPGTGRVRALSIRADELGRALAGWAVDKSVDALHRTIGKAAGGVHELLRHESTLVAKFGVAAVDPRDKRARHDDVLVVRDSDAGRHVIVRREDYVTVDWVDDRQLAAMLGERLAEAVEGRIGAVTEGRWRGL